MRNLLLAVFLLSLTASANDSLDKELGAQAYAKMDFTRAYELWLPLAKKGDREVQEAVAILLMSDFELKLHLDRETRDKKALFWMKQSAHNGHLKAIRWLSKAYRHGWLEVQIDEKLSNCYANALSNVTKVNQCDCLE